MTTSAEYRQGYCDGYRDAKDDFKETDIATSHCIDKYDLMRMTKDETDHYKEFIKKKLAHSLADYLYDHGLITFAEQELSEFGTCITANIHIKEIKETAD